jgi:hypothetical protein
MAKRGPKPRPKPHARWPKGKPRTAKPNKQIDRWLIECCAIGDPSASTPARELINSWLDWCHKNRLFSGHDQQAFGAQLSMRSFPSFGDGETWRRSGIRLLARAISSPAID